MFNSLPLNKLIYNCKGGKSYRFHPILEAEYFEESPQVNRAFFVGTDLDGSTVSGNVATSSEAAMVGERLDVRHDTAVTTAAAAGYAASSIMAKARLEGRRAKITIPLHCGLELWDVISIVDILANQSISYRVVKYRLEMDMCEGIYTQAVNLCAV